MDCREYITRDHIIREADVFIGNIYLFIDICRDFNVPEEHIAMSVRDMSDLISITGKVSSRKVSRPHTNVRNAGYPGLVNERLLKEHFISSYASLIASYIQSVVDEMSVHVNDAKLKAIVEKYMSQTNILNIRVKKSSVAKDTTNVQNTTFNFSIVDNVQTERNAIMSKIVDIVYDGVHLKVLDIGDDSKCYAFTKYMVPMCVLIPKPGGDKDDATSCFDNRDPTQEEEKAMAELVRGIF